VVERCRTLREKMGEAVRRLTCYHWWPAFA